MKHQGYIPGRDKHVHNPKKNTWGMSLRSSRWFLASTILGLRFFRINVWGFYTTTTGSDTAASHRDRMPSNIARKGGIYQEKIWGLSNPNTGDIFSAHVFCDVASSAKLLGLSENFSAKTNRNFSLARRTANPSRRTVVRKDLPVKLTFVCSQTGHPSSWCSLHLRVSFSSMHSWKAVVKTRSS